MVINALCKNFQRLEATARHAVLARHCSTRLSRVATNRANFLCALRVDSDGAAYRPNFLATSVRSSLPIDLDLPAVSIGHNREFPVVERKPTIGEPPRIRRALEDTVVDASLELPCGGTTTEKRAVTAIVIRRRKMKKHKRKKLRKRMRFLWGRIKQKREMLKEKAFHAELLAKIKKAESFDPATHIQQRFDILDEVRWPNKYRGVDLPEAQVREFILRDREKRAKKFNKPRLTL